MKLLEKGMKEGSSAPAYSSAAGADIFTANDNKIEYSWNYSHE